MKIRTCFCFDLKEFLAEVPPAPHERPAGVDERDARSMPKCAKCERPKPWAKTNPQKSKESHHG